MSNLDTAALRAAAKGVEPGQWYHGDSTGPINPGADAEYIAAAEPNTILALLDEVDRLREEVEDLTEKHGLISTLYRRQDAAISRVREMHYPVAAINYQIQGPRRMTRVCAGCGQDDGNWQQWPCPTVRAFDREA